MTELQFKNLEARMLLKKAEYETLFKKYNEMLSNEHACCGKRFYSAKLYDKHRSLQSCLKRRVKGHRCKSCHRFFYEGFSSHDEYVKLSFNDLLKTNYGKHLGQCTGNSCENCDYQYKNPVDKTRHNKKCKCKVSDLTVPSTDSASVPHVGMDEIKAKENTFKCKAKIIKKMKKQDAPAPKKLPLTTIRAEDRIQLSIEEVPQAVKNAKYEFTKKGIKIDEDFEWTRLDVEDNDEFLERVYQERLIDIKNNYQMEASWKSVMYEADDDFYEIYIEDAEDVIGLVMRFKSHCQFIQEWTMRDFNAC